VHIHLYMHCKDEGIGHLTISPTGVASYSKYIYINMVLVPLFQQEQLPLFSEGFPKYFGVFVWEFCAPIIQ